MVEAVKRRMDQEADFSGESSYSARTLSPQSVCVCVCVCKRHTKQMETPSTSFLPKTASGLKQSRTRGEGGRHILNFNYYIEMGTGVIELGPCLSFQVTSCVNHPRLN